MTNRAPWSRVTALAIAFVFAGLAGSRHASADSAQAPTAALSPELRAAFIAEMQHLDTGLQAAVSAIARAEWASVERIAHEIRGSFILEQRLSPEQLAELHRVLPEPFLALDRQFHAQAERLAHAAKARDGELAAFYAYKLTDGCVSCHANYARHRFQTLTPPPDVHHH
jgi:cytochrome c556